MVSARKYTNRLALKCERTADHTAAAYDVASCSLVTLAFTHGSTYQLRSWYTPRCSVVLQTPALVQAVVHDAC